MSANFLPSVLNQAVAKAITTLQEFADSPLFAERFTAVFGTSIAAPRFRALLASLPTIEVRSDGELRGALGAFSAQTGKIYLSEGLVKGDQARLQAVLIEEIGHFIDVQVNATDTPGDEGELFAKVVLGQPVSSAELVRLSAENDQAVVMLDGQAVAIEQAFGATGYLQFGTDGYDSGNELNIDNSNNIYVGGYIGEGRKLPGNSSFGNNDAFLVKYDSNGIQLWAKQFGTIGNDSISGLGSDNSGNVYAVGNTSGNLFGNSPNLDDAFIVKYDTNGNQLWAKQFGTSSFDAAMQMSNSVDGIYVTGVTYGGLLGSSNLGSSDIFIVKYDTSGNQLWAKQLGTSAYDSSAVISNDSDGNIYVAGITEGNLPNYSNSGHYDAFVVKYDANGNQLWAKQFGTSTDDYIAGIKADKNGNIYILGSIRGSYNVNNSMYGDVFIAKYESNGNQSWIKYIGTSDEDSGGGIVIDDSGNIYISGGTRGAFEGNSNLGYADAFVVKYNASGNQVWAKQFGTSADDSAGDIGLDSMGNIYIAGITYGNLPGNSNFGRGDVFIVGFDGNGNLLSSPTITLTASPASVTEDGTANLIYTFTRTGNTTNALTVNYNIAGTADATDYTGATPGTGKTITFTAGSSTATLTIDPTADTTIENDETIALTLTAGTGYTIGTTTAVTGTITNDDFPTVTLTVSPTSVTEDGTANLVYTFTRTGATTNALTVNYGITGTADATDYTGATPGTGKTITFTAGSSTATLTLDPTADTTIESNETVILTLASGTGYTVGTTTAVTGTITNDDPKITLAVSPTSVTEDGTTNLVYTFTRTGATTNALTVNYNIAGTATTTDYTGATPGNGKTITFASGSSTATLTIDPTADTTFEPNETVTVTLVSGTGYFLGTTTSATGTISDDDAAALSLSVNYQGISENSPSNLIYTFTRTGATTNALTVNYNIAGTATATDYTGATPGNGKTITFAAGSSTATLTLDPTADTTSEANETISLQLAAGTGYTISTTAAQIATIINDDSTRRQVGTSGKDLLLGTSGSDYLIGGAGDDELAGGTGSDIFYFASPNLGNDRLTDFTPNEDSLFVSGQGFGGGLIAGDTLTSAQFVLGSSATNTSQRFIYNSTTGALWFDVDGNGTQAAKQIATLNTGLALTFEDIFVA